MARRACIVRTHIRRTRSGKVGFVKSHIRRK